MKSNKYSIYIRILLIVLGVGIIFAPKVRDRYYLYKQTKILDDFKVVQKNKNLEENQKIELVIFSDDEVIVIKKEATDEADLLKLKEEKKEADLLKLKEEAEEEVILKLKDQMEELVIFSDDEVLVVEQEISDAEKVILKLQEFALKSDEYTLKLEEEEKALEEKQKKEKELKRLRAIKEKEARDALIQTKTEAILKIESINLEIPILDGASDDNLRLSISSLNETEKPWTKGNYAIAGHRSITYGKNFNRLDDLAPGHEILVTAIDGRRYTYIISEKSIVHEEEVSVLKSEKDKQTITLITCHPLYEKNPVNRLIIKGVLVK